MSSVTLEIRNNTDRKRFEAEVEGHIAFIDYIAAKGKIFLTHTEVPSQLGGRGIGSALVKGVLEELEKGGDKLFPLCPFVAAYLRRHPEWQRLLADGVHV